MVFAGLCSTLRSEYTWHGGHKLEREARRGRRLLRRDSSSCVERESWSAADRCPEQSAPATACWYAGLLSACRRYNGSRTRHDTSQRHDLWHVQWCNRKRLTVNVVPRLAVRLAPRNQVARGRGRSSHVVFTLAESLDVCCDFTRSQRRRIVWSGEPPKLRCSTESEMTPCLSAFIFLTAASRWTKKNDGLSLTRGGPLSQKACPACILDSSMASSGKDGDYVWIRRLDGKLRQLAVNLFKRHALLIMGRIRG